MSGLYQRRGHSNDGKWKEGSTESINPWPGAQKREGKGGWLKCLLGGSRKLHARVSIRWRHRKWGEEWAVIGKVWAFYEQRDEHKTKIGGLANKSRRMADSRVVRWIMDNNFGNERKRVQASRVDRSHFPIWFGIQMEVFLYIASWPKRSLEQTNLSSEHRISRSIA
jgi:hypothetical protein